jgi:hypothetical protein
MKFSLIPLLAAGAAITNVAAAPIRVVMVSSHIETPSGEKIEIMRPIPQLPQHQRRPCGSRVPAEAEKALSISNAFRHAVGWDRIEPLRPITSHHPTEDAEDAEEDDEAGSRHPTPHGRPTADSEDEAGFLHILPFPFNRNNPNLKWFKPLDREDERHGHHHKEHHHKEHHKEHHKHHHKHHSKHHGHKPGFWRRIHVALESLGTWEGRAVAFVLGCGLGVLLRMFYVMTVVLFRAFRPAQETVQYGVIHIYEDAPLEAPAAEVAPPTYPADVKVPVPEEKA